MDFSGKLSRLMEDNKTTDQVLADYVGVSRQAIYRWRNGSHPSFDKVSRIAEFFDVPAVYFSDDFEKKHYETINKIVGNIEVPIIGSIRAGYPVESYEVIEDYVSLPAGVKYSEDLFALRVVGDSMMPLVMEGDIIICDRNTESANGRICAVTVDEESTLKRVRIDSTGVTLIPTNPMYKELHYSSKKAEEVGFHIDGVLVQMIRNF